ncbi:MAG TPA: hypothetical protein DCY52_06230, partial [Methylococcaceae bacterium]|nr:hypothetical protein [Methylococcaceae bacterium]
LSPRGVALRFIRVSLRQFLKSNDRKGAFIPKISALLMRRFDEVHEQKGRSLVNQHLTIDPRVGLGGFSKCGAFRSVM